MSAYRDIINDSSFTGDDIECDNAVIGSLLDITSASLLGFPADELTTTFSDTLSVKNLGILDKHIHDVSASKITGSFDDLSITDDIVVGGLVDGVDISLLESAVLENIDNISANMATISTNVADISTNAADIATNVAGIANNTADITTNTAAISTNTAAIVVNTGDILTNRNTTGSNLALININIADIATNAADIATNMAAISTNVAGIATNVTDIATNVTNIATNTASIATNVTDIASNAANITVLAADIVTNTADIATNTAALAGVPTSGADVDFGHVNCEGLRVYGTGNINVWLEADTDNVSETDNPLIIMTQDNHAIMGTFGMDENNKMFLATYKSSSNSGISLRTGGVVSGTTVGTVPTIDDVAVERLFIDDSGAVTINGSASITSVSCESLSCTGALSVGDTFTCSKIVHFRTHDAVAYIATNHSIDSDVWTDISFETTVYDDSSELGVVFGPLLDGYYRIEAYAKWVATSGGSRFMRLYDGTSEFCVMSAPSTYPASNYTCVSYTGKFLTTQTVYIQGYQNSGSAINISGGRVSITFLGI